MKCIDKNWFTNSCGVIGLVVSEDDQGERKAFISQVAGYDEETDVQTVMSWGASVDPRVLERILTLLVKGGKDDH